MTTYLPLLHQIDAWHAEGRAAHPGTIPCRPGCAACCHGPFDISVADAELIAAAFTALPAEIRASVHARAGAGIERMRHLAPDLSAPWDVSLLGEAAFDAVCDALADEPCPCLDEAGRCLVYQARPLVCRIMGLGLVRPEGGTIPNACPIQEEFPGYAALAPRPFDLAAWEAREGVELARAADSLLGDRAQTGYETTVAGAILLGQERLTTPAPFPPAPG